MKKKYRIYCSNNEHVQPVRFNLEDFSFETEASAMNYLADSEGDLFAGWAYFILPVFVKE